MQIYITIPHIIIIIIIIIIYIEREGGGVVLHPDVAKLYILTSFVKQYTNNEIT